VLVSLHELVRRLMDAVQVTPRTDSEAGSVLQDLLHATELGYLDCIQYYSVLVQTLLIDVPVLLEEWIARYYGVPKQLDEQHVVLRYLADCSYKEGHLLIAPLY